jgi:Na+/proline symporter
MVPPAVLILTASALFAKNVCRPILAPAMTDDQVAKLAKIMVVVLVFSACISRSIVHRLSSHFCCSDMPA